MLLRLAVFVIAVTEASEFVTFDTFTAGCEGNGAGDITTLADCSAAAAALGLSQTTPEEVVEVVDPPYCYLKENANTPERLNNDMYAVNCVPPTLLQVSLIVKEIMHIQAIPAINA